MRKTISHIIQINILVLLGLVLIPGCQEDDETAKITKEKVSGFIQKGPYVSGTTIDIFELNGSLGQTGKVFRTNIINNQGSFEINNISLSSQFVELSANGYYFNEVLGNITSGPLVLIALSDITDISTINVNILTHLEKERIEFLVEAGTDFTQAKQQAQSEILSIFGFSSENINNSELLDISNDSEGNSMLIAISVILQGNRSVGELAELLSNIITDIKPDGILDNETIKSTLYNTPSQLNLVSIRNNLEQRYSELGISATIPDFESKIESFLSSEQPFDIETEVTHVLCNGDNSGAIDITVNEGTAPFTFTWSNGATTEDISNLIAGVYSVTITDANGFSVSNIGIEITEPPSIALTYSIIHASTIEATDGIIYITVNGGTAPYTYQWSNGSTTEDVDNISYGIYKVTVNDNNGCTFNSENITVFYTEFDPNMVADIDGNEYNITKIGEQYWITENLLTTTFNDGESISLNTNTGGWYQLSTPAYCYPENSQDNVDPYGLFYNWHAVSSEKLCPIGWHVPTDDDWKELEIFLGMSETVANTEGYRGSGEGGKLKETGTLYWNNPNTGATNETNFTALPAGYLELGGGTVFLGSGGMWWSGSLSEDQDVWIRGLSSSKGSILRSDIHSGGGVSVRCVRK